MGVERSHMNPIAANLIILSRGVELSAMKLYVIMTKVRVPPEMFWTGMTVASQTHLFHCSR